MIYLPWLKDVLINWSVIVAMFCIILLTGNLILSILAIIIIGNRQHALAILGHEGTHFFISKKRWLNEILNIVFCFGPIMVNHFGYRKYHWDHHRYTNTLDDPKFAGKLAVGFNNSSKARIWTQFILDLCGFGLIEGIVFASYIPATRTDYIIKAVIAAIFLLLFIFCWQIPAIWLIALGTSYIAFSRLRVWHEHVGVGEGEHTHRIKPSLLTRLVFLPHNAWCHWEHHETPGIPYDKLPDIADPDGRKLVKDIHK